VAQQLEGTVAEPPVGIAARAPVGTAARAQARNGDQHPHEGKQHRG